MPLIRERGSSVVIGSLSDERRKFQEAERRKPTEAFGFSSRQITIVGFFSRRRRPALLKTKRDATAAAAAKVAAPRPSLPYRSCLVPCYPIAPTSSPLANHISHSHGHLGKTLRKGRSDWDLVIFISNTSARWNSLSFGIRTSVSNSLSNRYR